jgi:hypothetical protein
MGDAVALLQLFGFSAVFIIVIWVVYAISRFGWDLLMTEWWRARRRRRQAKTTPATAQTKGRSERRKHFTHKKTM